jgi:CO/xanthine dehydrogenase Mo-binding subunit
MTTTEQSSKYRVIGTRPVRHDGVDKVTGAARYGADINLPGMLHAKVLRSPYSHARIRGIDTSKAEAMPGVVAVTTSADFPIVQDRMLDFAEVQGNARMIAENMLAKDKALYVGHAIAAVCAVSQHVAEEALSLVEVDYEVLPTVLTWREAMADNATLLHDDMTTYFRVERFARGDDTGIKSNVAGHIQHKVGDVEQGFAESDIVIEREFETQTVHQGYIEPHSATALWNSDGMLTIWCSSQGHFNVRDQSASILGIPVSQVKVVPLEIGGGFGGKTLVYLEPVAAALSRKTGRAVKVSMSRTEVFEGTGPTSGSYMKVKMGVTNEGRITAADAVLAYEAGAYPGSPVNPGMQCIFGCYDIPNARVQGYDVVLNHPKTAAYRAPGSPAAAFACETVVDEICGKLGMDPIDFRMLNGSKEGTRRVPGPMFGRIGFLETIQAAKEHDHWSAPLEGPNRGRGIAGGFWFNGTGPSSALASVTSDGTVTLVEGSPDIGGSRAVAAMHVAEVLGIAAEDVRPQVGDTNSIGFTSMTGGSGVAFKTGWASYEAAQEIKRQMIERAAMIWDISSDDVEYKDGVISHKSEPELRFTFKELAARLNGTGGPIAGRANVDPRGVGGAFAVHIVDVEVDPDTGKVDILRYTALQDAGKAVHPGYVEGQIQGGAVQGIGWALNEEYFFTDRGEMANSSFLDYRMPTSLDLPMIDTVIVEVPNPRHPYGVRGVGEVPIVPPLAAVANAVHAAVGVRMTACPMSPPRVLAELKAKARSPQAAAAG